jgi:hypothetical protein
MGLAQGTTAGVMNLAKYKSNWDMLPDKAVKSLYDRVMGHLTQRRPYGEYFAMREIFGDQVAMEVVRHGEIMAPPGATGGNVKAVRKVKAIEPEPMDVDDDDDIEMMDV